MKIENNTKHNDSHGPTIRGLERSKWQLVQERAGHGHHGHIPVDTHDTQQECADLHARVLNEIKEPAHAERAEHDLEAEDEMRIVVEIPSA